VEQLEHRRKDMCVEMLRECYMSAQKMLNNMVESEEFRSCITEGKPGELAPNSVAEAKAMVKATMRECETLMNRRAAEGPNWYNIDGNLRLAELAPRGAGCPQHNPAGLGQSPIVDGGAHDSI
jgi:hypothetical protein